MPGDADAATRAESWKKTDMVGRLTGERGERGRDGKARGCIFGVLYATQGRSAPTHGGVWVRRRRADEKRKGGRREERGEKRIRSRREQGNKDTPTMDTDVGEGPVVPLPAATSAASAFAELLASESRYLADLDRLCALYLTKIELNDEPWKAGFSSNPDIVLLFTTIKGIETLNRTLFQRLQSLANKSKNAVGDAYVVTDECARQLGSVYTQNSTLFARYLRCYQIYMSTARARDALVLTPEFTAFQSFLQRQHAASVSERAGSGRSQSGSVDLASFEALLARPVKHLNELEQLVGDILAAVAIGDNSGKNGEVGEAVSALQAAVDMLRDVQKKVRQAEVELKDRREVQALEAKMFSGKPGLVEQGRRLVFEGELRKVSRNRNHKYYFHLFNDLLIYSERSGTTGKYTLHRKMDLRSVDAIDNAQVQQATEHAFEIKSAEKSFQVIAPSKKLKYQWLTQVHNCIADLRKTTGHSAPSATAVAATWESDHNVAECKYCKRVRKFGSRGSLGRLA